MEPHLNTIAIVVSNLSETLNFYRVLGLNIPQGQESEIYVECVSPNASTICFIPKASMRKLNPDWKEPAGKGSIGMHFKFDTADGIETAYNRLMEMGYDSVTAPHDAKWGERFAEVMDPDGNTVSLFAHLKHVKHPFSFSALQSA